MESNIKEAISDVVGPLFEWSRLLYHNVPGMSVIGRYIRNSYQNDPIRVVLELILLLFAVKYLMSKKYKPDSKDVALSEKEVDDLVQEWQPETLVPAMSDFARADLDSVPIIQGASGPHVKLADSDGKDFLNMASFDFLGLTAQLEIHEVAAGALRKYGVGACGPPGFYGTIDAHIELEKDLARFIGTEEAIIYSQAFSTISSVIPAFAKRGDILVVDEGVNFAMQKGIQISRSTVKYFKHNDMADLERVLNGIKAEDKKAGRQPLNRRFIVTEGLYQNFGDIVPLPKLLEMKKKFKFRLIIDETMSFGVLGSRGAGVTDHFSISPQEVDIISGSMANSLASAGGFCAGSKEVVDHQRLSGAAYCFSAALPALLAVASIEGLKYLERNPAVLKRLRDNISAFYKGLGSPKNVKVNGDATSPVIHVYTNGIKYNNTDEEELALQKVVNKARSEHILITRAKYVRDQEVFTPKPSIRIALTAAHSTKEVEAAAKTLRKAIESSL